MTTLGSTYYDPKPLTNGQKLQKPPTGSATAAQTVNTPFGGLPFALGAGLMPLGPGGTPANPLAFPFWTNGQYPGGMTWVYDWMLRHPRIQQVRNIVFAPIVSSSWVFDCEPGVEKKRDAIAKNWNQLRASLVPNALRALDYGCAKFEPVWDVVDGLWTITQMKPLDFMRAGVWSDLGGNFTGFGVALRADIPEADRDQLESGLPSGGPNLPVNRGKAWLYTFDSLNGYLHGRSILENIRETAWIPWLTTAQQVILIGGKVSGRQAYGLVPPGGYTDPATGTTRTYQQDMKDVMLGFAEGKSPIMTNLTVEAEDENGYVDPELKAKLARESLIKFDVVDFGNQGPTLDALNKNMQHYEDLMYAGYHRSARTGMESQHGSRADAEQHTDTGTIDSQNIADSIAAAAQPLLDYQVKINFNLPPGTIRIRNAPLTDKESAAATSLTTAIMQTNTDVSMAVAQKVDWQRLFDAAHIPNDPAVSVTDLLEQAQDQKQQQAAQLQQAKAAQPDPNDPKTAKAARVAGRLAKLMK